MRLIDADDLKKELNKNRYYVTYKVFDIIDNAPTIEKRPQGEWLKNANEIYKCSLCGAYGNPNYFRFCPNCGAIMKGD